MLKALYGACDVPRRGNVASALRVIPDKSQAAVMSSTSIGADLVVLFERGQQVVGVG